MAVKSPKTARGIEMLKFISGDVLQTTNPYIAQGVATGSQEGLGMGLALKISKKWPDAQQQFKKYTRSNSFGGGDVFIVPPTGTRPGIIYMATQPDMYHATLPFLNKALKNLVKSCEKQSIKVVALPKIGAGLGKLDWETEVKPAMMKTLTDSEIEFLVYEDFKIEFESQ